ncbi:LamG-like jellyroll fold domain-containing protein [Christiangramia portivictoriae]|uniref:Ig-like domain-containing protein n=1 Tax=Christiangramia portivictoriae TaxID=326069 RepID=UPI000478B300|nr:LamG-like jellyroll fold domain-containing protein [Christiangramia portivictoriae]
MVRKLHWKTFIILLIAPVLTWGQVCPTSVSLQTDTGNSVCAGTDVLFTATTTGGVGIETYQWKINGNNAGSTTTSNTFSSNTLNDGDYITVTVTDIAGVVCNLTSSRYTMTVNPLKTPTVNFLVPPGNKCIGQNITLEGSNTNGGSSPNYEWFVDGISVQSSTNRRLIQTFSAAKTYNIRLLLTSNIDCFTSQTAEVSKTLTIQPDASISISESNINDACTNTAIPDLNFSLSGAVSGASASGLPPGVTGSYSTGNFRISGTPTTAGTYNYTVTATGACASASQSGTITVLEDAGIELTSGNELQEVCQGESIGNIIYTIGQTADAVSISGLPTGITGTLSGQTFTISGSSSLVGTHNYSIFSTGDCANSEVLEGSITVNENLTPGVSITSSEDDNEICAGTVVTFTASTTNEGGTPDYQWKINNINATDAGNTNVFTTSSLNDGDIVSVELTSSETCTTSNPVLSNEIQTTVLENLVPSVTITASDTDICPGDEVNFSIESITNAGTNPSYQWKLDGVNVGTNSNSYTTSNLTNGQNISLEILSSETCLASEAAFSNEITIEVFAPVPDTPGQIAGDTEVCATATGLIYKVPPVDNATNYTWNFPAGWSITSGAGTNSVTVNAGTGSGEISVVASNSCGDSANSTFSVNSVNGVPSNPGVITSDLNGNNNICPPYTINFSVGSTGPHTWTVPAGWDIISGAGTNSIQVNVTNAATSGTREVSVVAENICGESTPATYTGIEINDHIIADFGEDQTICKSQNSIQLSGTRSFGGATLPIDFTTSGTGTFTNKPGNSNKTGDFTVVYNPSTQDRANGEILLTMTVPEPKKDNDGNICNESSDSITLYIIQDAVVSSPAEKDQIVCINNAISSIDFEISEAGTGATVSGLPPGLTGSFTDGIFSISGTPTVDGDFDYTVTSTGECSSQQTSITGNITVTPDHEIVDAANKDQTVCIDSAMENISFGINTSVESVATEGLPAGVSGIIDGNNFVLSGTPLDSGTFVYTLTTAGNCESTTTTGTLTVLPDVTISEPDNKDQTICINAAAEAMEFTITEPGSGAVVTGLPNGMTGTFTNGIFTISGNPTEAGVFNYEITTSGTCDQATESGSIEVTPDPTAEIAYSGEFCTSQGGSYPVALVGTGTFEGGTFSATPSGLIIDETTGDITPSLSIPNTYTVRYEGPDICNRAIATTEIIINEEPSVEIAYASAYCTSISELQNPVFQNGTGNYEAGIFTAEPGGLSIDATTGAINPQASSAGTYNVYYTIPAANSCDEVVITTQVTITRLPAVTISYPEIICNSEESIAVTYSNEDGIYQNGTFRGSTGLAIDEDGQIDPSGSVPGDHIVTYTIESTEACEKIVSTANFTIKEEPVITTNPSNNGVCSNGPASFEVFASGDDLTYEWFRIVEGVNELIPGQNGSVLNFSNVTAQDALEYFVVVSGADSCSPATSTIFTLNVDEDITITEPSEDITICEESQDDITFTFKGHANGAILDFKWIKDGETVIEQEGKIDIEVEGPVGTNGEYTGTLTITNPTAGEDGDSGEYWVVVDGPDYFTCSEATSNKFTFRVESRPPKPETVDLTLCLNEEAGNLTATVEDGNETRWYTFNDATSEYEFIGNNVSIDSSEPRTYQYFATQTRPNACESDYEPITVTILDTPDPISTEPLVFEFCFEEEISEAISITPADNATINWYASMDASESIAAPVPNTGISENVTYYVSQTFASTGCESDRTPVEIRIKDLPNVLVEIDGDNSNICLGSSITLNASGAESYEWYIDETTVATGATYSPTPTEAGEITYTVVGTSNGCINSYNITINVDDVSVAGTLSAPERICVQDGVASLSLTGTTGEIIRWEYKSEETSDAWINFEDGNLSAERTFTLTETTSYRVTVQNGVCSEDSAEATIYVDPLPEGGKLLWDSNQDRLFLTCENPSNGFASRLSLSGYTGEVAYWEYRNAPSNTWQRIETEETFLSGNQIENVINNLSTTFRAVLTNGSCTGAVYSETAITSVIVADIKPTPVEVDKPVICIGDEISLSSETGYSTTGEKFEGGQFTEAGIKNKGWDFTQPDGTVNDYDAAANNGRADHWLKMNASGGEDGKVYTGTLPSGDTGTTIRWTSELNVNEKFALVTGPNDSYMETPIFSLSGMDEAIFTWDQGYNLTAGATITVEISTNGGSSYETVLYTHTGDGTVAGGSSGNYIDFGGGTPSTRPKNKMVVDLGDYLGQSNLRIRFNYDGRKDGDVWAVDNIKVPEGPQDILLQWYYDDDLSDDGNALEEIGEVNQSTVLFTPRKIGWNDFEVQTRIILDSNGNACQSIDNFETIRVWAFDQYNTNVSATVGACGSLSILLNATVTATQQAMEITEYPTLDGYVGSWKVFDSNDIEITTGFSFENQDSNSNLQPVNDPDAIFTAENLGDYQIRWVLTPTATDENGVLIENEGCPPIDNTETISLVDCVTLDFDGDDDYVDLGNNYTGSFFLEAWIMPFDRPLPEGGMTDASKGTIFSAPGFELSMENLPSFVEPNNRWYHIAVSSDGSILYIDGIKADGISVNTSGTNTAAIGARYSASSKTATNHFSGWIEEVRIWNNAPSEKEIRFMMNQRLKLNSSNQVVSPIEGEVVPNKTVDGSYYTSGGFNLDKDGVSFYDQTAADLAGYYRLYSNDPDPDNKLPGYFLDALKPLNGLTPNHANAANPGRMVNIETDQENTSPTPYFSYADGSTWTDINTWARPEVWDAPNSLGHGNSPIDWNIARINHTFAANRAITMLGLLSETSGKELTINASNPIKISHYLYLDGSIDLQGESQLLQDHGSILANESAGFIEIDQQGRMSSFNYNYWTSPVSTQGTANNSGYRLVDVLLDGTNAENPTGINWKTGYFDADGARTSPITITDAWIWDFRGGDADIYGDWLFMGSDFMQIAGAGYSMKGTDGTVAPNQMTQNYVFKGKPNNGDIPTSELSLNSDQNFLVGNPFPSALDADEFLRDNLKSVGTGTGNNSQNVFNGTLYYWDHFAGSTHILEEYVGGYATYTLAGSAPAILNDWRISQVGGNGTKQAKQYIPVAQGFFLNSAAVNGNTFGGQIQFNNTQRIYKIESTDPSIFLQQEDDPKSSKNKTGKNSEDDRAKIRLKFESPAGYHRQILVTRDANTTNGFDIGYDAPLIENNKEDMYWWFADNRFVIQGVPDFEKEQVLPLAIKTFSEGSFTIKIDSTENWPASKELYLKDKQNDSIHDLLAGSFKGSTTEGEISDRFEIVFFNEMAQEPDPVIIPEEPELPVVDGLVGISYSTFSRNVKISNEDLLKVEKVLIYDMGGKLIQEFDGLPSEKEIYLGLRPVRSGIYIVKVFCENAICNKKIIVK